MGDAYIWGLIIGSTTTAKNSDLGINLLKLNIKRRTLTAREVL